MILFYKKDKKKKKTNILLVFLEWIDKKSNVKFEKIKINLINGVLWYSLILSLFCFSFTFSYFDSYGILYFHHFDYSDIYNFTLSRISMFFDVALYILTIAVAFLGFYMMKNKEEDYFTNLQVSILWFILLSPVLYIILFVYYYTNSIISVIVNTVILIGLIIMLYKQQKEKHDIFLIGIIALLMFIGKLLGNEFAKNRFNEKEFIELEKISNGEKILNECLLVIAQNNAQFIIINKQDTSVVLYPKSENIKVNFKGRIKK